MARARIRAFRVGAVASALGLSLLAVGSTTAGRTAAACPPTTTILKSPRAGSKEVQATGLNDRGDIVGFADSKNGSSPIHAILWRGGRVEGAVDLGVLPGYVSSEAYGVNNDGLVFGLLYDRKERTFPFRWKAGRMTLLKGPNGRIQPASGNPGAGGRNTVNERGEIAWTLIVGGNPRAVRWSAAGRATLLPRLPGHAWSWSFGINNDGVVSGWSRKQGNEDGAENPVIWPRSGGVVPMKTAPGRADGIAEATNSAGLTVGYLGNQTEKEPESDQGAVWRTRTAKPRLLGPRRPNFITELVDVNDRGQVAGLWGTLNPRTGFTAMKPVIWQSGWEGLRSVPIPAASSRANRVVITGFNDINARGTIVGNAYGLSAPAYSKLRRIDPVVWRCQFGG